MAKSISGIVLNQPLSDLSISTDSSFTMGGILTTNGAGVWGDTGTMHFQFDQGVGNWIDLNSVGALNIASQTNPITNIQDTNEHIITVYNNGSTGTFNIRIYVIDEDTDEFYSTTVEVSVQDNEKTIDAIQSSTFGLSSTNHKVASNAKLFIPLSNGEISGSYSTLMTKKMKIKRHRRLSFPVIT